MDATHAGLFYATIYPWRTWGTRAVHVAVLLTDSIIFIQRTCDI
nr:MAG TPA: hypothetical protein [Caudoviricetes sp.]DAJ46839.1 MAG TPA: hypothetical protein [Bacteriophage sp.]